MTCEDCKYFDAYNHPTTSGFMSRAGHCDKRVADGYDEYPLPECEICNLFEPKEDSWGERERMSKEKAYEIVKHHGIGYTEADYDEALSIIRQSLGITEEIESPVIAIAGLGYGTIEIK